MYHDREYHKLVCDVLENGTLKGDRTGQELSLYSTLWLNPAVTEIDNFTYNDFEILDYESHPTIKMEVSV